MRGRKINSAEVSSSGVSIETEKLSDGSVEKAVFDRAVVCAGRIPQLDGLGLEKAGVETRGGFIKADKNMKTTVDKIFAAGDVVNSVMLAHAAYREGAKAAKSACGVNSPGIDYNLIPRVVFSIPQVACVGMTERAAKEADLNVKVKKSFFKANSKAVIARETAGFAKAVYNAKDNNLLGVSVIGASAGELIHAVAPVIAAGMTADEAGRIIYAHPTLSEIFSGITGFREGSQSA